MKKVIFFIAVLFLTMSCTKNKHTIQIAGKALDYVDKQPVAGLSLGVFKTSWDFNILHPIIINYQFSTQTDDKGQFSFQVPDAGLFYLGSENIPDKYQTRVLINGKDYPLYERDKREYWILFPIHYGLNEDDYLNIEMFPNAWWRFTYPPVPTAYMQDTLFIKMDGNRNLISGNASHWEYDGTYFILNNLQYIEDLDRIMLSGTNFEVSGNYTLKRGTTIHHSGSFKEICVPGDTMQVRLEW